MGTQLKEILLEGPSGAAVRPVGVEWPLSAASALPEK